MTELTRATIETAIKKMVNDGYLSICTIDKILKLTGGIPNAEDYQQLSLLHCVNYSAMHPTVKAALPELINRVISSEGFEIRFEKRNALEEASAVPRKTSYGHLIPWYKKII